MAAFPADPAPSVRVAHVLRKLDARAWGGTETHVAAMTRELGRLGVRSEVHAPNGPTQGGMPDGVPIKRFHTLNPFIGAAGQRAGLVANAGNLITLDEIARLARDRAVSLAHLHTAGRIGGAVRTAMRVTGRPYVVSVHGPLLAEPAYLAADTKARTRGLVDLGQPFGALLGARRVIDDAARVIVFNDAEHAALERRIGRRAVRMDHGVDLARFASGSSVQARARWPELGDAPLVLMIGRLSAQKNQRLAVAAFARSGLRSARLVLVGAETDAGAAASIREEARACGVAERVHMLGNVAPALVPDLLAASRLVLIPSLHEAFGLAVLEAWAASRPVLFSRRAGLLDLARRVGGPEVALDVERESSIQDWAAQIARFVSTPELGRAAAEQGHALVRRELTWAHAAARLRGLYDEVLAERAIGAVA